MKKAIPETMRAAAIDHFGGIKQITLRSLPVPGIGPYDVLIRVDTAGVGSWDADEREGKYDGVMGFESTFPYVLGWEGTGTVAAVGNRVTRVTAGEEVYAVSMPLPKGGFYAEYAAVGLVTWRCSWPVVTVSGCLRLPPVTTELNSRGGLVRSPPLMDAGRM